MYRTLQTLPLFIVFLPGPVGSIFAEDAAPTLEFRLADDNENPGWSKMKLPEGDKSVFVSGKAELDDSHIEKVSFCKDANGNSSVGFTLTDDGAQAMEATTSRNINKRLAIVLNGKVVSAPIIRSVIKKEGMITGHFDKDDLLAFFQAIVLRESP